jgi:hypothetical protein
MNPSTPSDENVLPALKTPILSYAFIIIILILMIMLFYIIYKVPSPDGDGAGGGTSKSTQKALADTVIVVVFALLIVVICVTLLPSLKEIKKLFEQISNVTYVIIFTIALILFFTLTPDATMSKYAHLIAPASIVLCLLIFYKGFSPNYSEEKFNVNYERIKMMILFYCMITIFIIYYHNDPGGYIQKYFGYSLLVTIIIAVFAFLYLIILLTLPDKVIPTASGDKTSNFLDNFSGITSYGGILFLVFIVAITIIISTYPGGFFNKKEMSNTAMILLLIICIFWSLLICGRLFIDKIDPTMSSSKMSLWKRVLLILFGLVILGLSIAWIVYNVEHLSGKSSIVSFVLNMILLILVLGLIYKTVVVRLPVGNSNKNAFFSLIMNTVFYIPCVFSEAFDYIGSILSGKANSETVGSLLMLLIVGILIAVYYYFPSVFNAINIQGGKQLVNKPVYTNSVYSLGNYQQLNGTDAFDYQYAISFWFFLDANPPNTSASSSKYTSLLNFGNKPNVLYNSELNTLRIVMYQRDLPITTTNQLTDFDDDGNRIIYTNDKVLLQKWNNLVINYSGGVLDIFLNGELVKSSVGVVPYYTIDNLTIGETDGVNGGICNVVYFNQALTASNMYYLYNMAKHSTPPVLNDSSETILVQNITQVDSSIKNVL